MRTSTRIPPPRAADRTSNSAHQLTVVASTSLAYDASGTRTDTYFSGTQDIETRVDGAVAAENVFSPVYVNAILLRDAGGERVYFTADANYNVTGVVGTSGTMLQRQVYDAYGNVTFADASWNPLTADGQGLTHLYQGMLYAPEIGWYYSGQSNFARWYSPGLMVWTRGDAGYIDSMDLYQYCGDEPINRTDPNGNISASPVSDQQATSDGWAQDVTGKGYGAYALYWHFRLDKTYCCPVVITQTITYFEAIGSGPTNQPVWLTADDPTVPKPLQSWLASNPGSEWQQGQYTEVIGFVPAGQRDPAIMGDSLGIQRALRGHLQWGDYFPGNTNDDWYESGTDKPSNGYSLTTGMLSAYIMTRPLLRALRQPPHAELHEQSPGWNVLKGVLGSGSKGTFADSGAFVEFDDSRLSTFTPVETSYRDMRVEWQADKRIPKALMLVEG